VPRTSSDTILRAAAQRLVFRAIRAHPDWSLLDLVEHLDARAPVGAILSAVEISELSLALAMRREVDAEPPPSLSEDRLDAARHARGTSFDAIVHELLVEARGPVGARRLCEQLGTSRDKLRRSLLRLIDAGLAERTGSHNKTRYRARLR